MLYQLVFVLDFSSLLFLNREQTESLLNCHTMPTKLVIRRETTWMRRLGRYAVGTNFLKRVTAVFRLHEIHGSAR